MEKSEDWVVRDGNEMDQEKVLSLRKIVFGEMEVDKLDPKFWKWEFTEGADGKALIYIIEDGDRVVGHFADLPRRFFVNGEVVHGTVSIDLMVHPDYRRKGFFFRMGGYAAQCVQKENGHFMISFPIREETIDGFKKLGWNVISKLPVLVYPIRFQGILHRYLHSHFLSLILGGIARGLYSLVVRPNVGGKTGGIELEEVTQLDDQFNQFWQKALFHHPLMGVRDQPYLRWRYLQHPTRSYTLYRAMRGDEMVGYMILRKVDLLKFKSMVIVDLLALDNDILAALIRKGIEYSRNQGTDLLGFMLPKRHNYYQILRRMGFLPSLKTFLLMIYPIQEKKALLQSQNWYVNWGDTDVI
jgi:GNAT superfamily N-acetyltransferase